MQSGLLLTFLVTEACLSPDSIGHAGQQTYKALVITCPTTTTAATTATAAATILPNSCH